MRDPSRRRPTNRPIREQEPKPELRPNAGDRAGDKLPKSPLLMMPMRLEYRVINRAQKTRVRRRPDHAVEVLALRRKLAHIPPDQVKDIAEIQSDIAKLRARNDDTRLTLDAAKLESPTEIWIRWYPDDSFAESGVAPPSPAEAEALAAFTAHPASRDWPKLTDGESTALWAELAAIAGPARAVHLMRQRGAAGDPYWQDRIGRITGLPDRVAVFAQQKGTLSLLAEGRDIPANNDWGAGLVSYSPASLDDTAWISDFDSALDLGMGVKLQSEEQVKQALEADWLICVGLSGENGAKTLTHLLQDKIAGGGFELLAQDTPTNNTPNALAGAQAGDTAQEQLAAHTQLEFDELRDKGLGIDLLAGALGLDRSTLAHAKGAQEAGHLDAAAMIRLIGPALMDGSLAATSQMNNVSDVAFIELLARHVQARGLLPSLRIGTSAYGILPVTDDYPTPAGNYALSSVEADYQDFIRFYGAGVRSLMAATSEATTLRMEPDDPDASEKLTDILQSSRVSRRLDVAEEGEEDVAGLGCPYVEGPAQSQTPAAYLRDLAIRPVRDFIVPDASNDSWPLLYRLAHLSIIRNREMEVLRGSPGFTGRGNLRKVQGNWMNSLTSAQRDAIFQSRVYSVERFSTVPNAQMPLIPNGKLPLLKAVNSRMNDALVRLRAVALRPDGTAQLETLLMEVIDLFQHRLDAWMTGLASVRLEQLRKDHPKTGLKLGYYGMVGRLRSTSATAPSDGYLQAPSQGQAVTAAILRSAFLRNRAEGAFEIDLSAKRTQRALRLMDHIRHGIALPECLGLRGERFLRDRMKSAVIYELREAFPLENPDVDGEGRRGGTGTRCFDGLKLLEASDAKLSDDQRGLKAALYDDLDALSDLVVAEAVHHRASGAADVASAWLRVLSGGPIPHRPEFLRTYRSGHASDYRVTLVLPQVPPAQEGSPLRLAEYGLAGFMDQSLPDLAQAEALAEVRAGDALVHRVVIALGKDLALDAITIGKLGLEPLMRRLKAHAIADLHAKMPLDEMRKRGWTLDEDGAKAAGLRVELTLDDTQGDMARAAELWQIAHAGQPLSAGDLANAADPAHPLDEAAHIAALQGAAADLWARAERLLAHAQGARDTYAKLVRRIFKAIAERYGQAEVRFGDDERLDQKLRAYVTELHGALGVLERLHLDGAMRRPAAKRLTEDMVAQESALRGTLDQLDSRIAALRAALGQRVTDARSLSDARADLNAAIAALQGISGQEALAVFPVFAKAPALAPLLTAAQPPATALGPWPRYRGKLARLLAGLHSGHQAYAVHPDATANDTADEAPDRRPESDAPRAYHRGLFLSPAGDIAATTISGIVVDEWVETRPSRQQDAAIALNYDSPQAEAPNCLVLAVPEDPFAPHWDHARAARMVGLTLDLMKLRALTTQTTPLSDTILPLANQVAHKGSGTNERPRLPEAKYNAGLKEWFAAAGTRMTIADADLDALGGGWNQTNRFGKKRRTTP